VESRALIPAGARPEGTLDAHETLATETARVGGKALGLARLTVAGLAVPPWLAVPLSTVEAMLAAPDSVIECWLALLLKDWLQPPFDGLAIRSSAPGEDDRQHSMAGQYRTLFVRERHELSGAFRAVAGWGPGAGQGDAIPVVLQAVVGADVSGIAFSANPAEADPEASYMEWLPGAGEALAQGEATPNALTCPWLGQPIPAEAPAFVPVLLESLRVAEECLGCAVDMEWCQRGNVLWVLQARPITALHLAAREVPGETLSSWFLDQRFPDPISMITRDTLLPLVADVAFGDAMRMRGHAPPEKLVHYYAGRAYVPLRVLSDMLRGAPGWWLSPDLRAIFRPARRPPGGVAALLHYAWCALRTVLHHRRDVFFNLRAWEDYKRGLVPELEALPATFDSVEELEHAWRACDALSRRYLEIHRWSILWADYGFRLYRALLILLPETWGRRLEAALADRMELHTLSANEALRLLQTGNDGSHRDELLRRFGDRSTSLDFATPTWGELYGEGIVPPRAELPVERGWRDALGLLARLLELREEQRSVWERILARQRRLLLHAAHLLRQSGKLALEEEIWMLTWRECLAALSGGPAPETTELELRRHIQRVQAVADAPPLVAPIAEGGTQALRDPSEIWHGAAASFGSATGRALLVHKPDPARPPEAGCVLVLRSLDPACSLLIQQAAGLVVERGGLLSHAAILAREYRVPMVMEVPGIMGDLRDGDLVKIDGTLGSVERLEKGPYSSAR
jgi:pyruvate,water dikinase